MTWSTDLRQQVLAEFRDAQRRRGELGARDEEATSPAPAAVAVEKQATAARQRRIVRRAA